MIVNNLTEFLDERGCGGPYQWARALYKYTDCGPWVSFVIRAGDIYYGDITDDFAINSCTGVKVGSIVEGSDVEIGPYQLDFPFDTDDFDKTVEGINAESSFYWEQANSEWYYIQGKHCANLQAIWGEYKWSEDKGDELPAEDKASIESYISETGSINYDKPATVGEYNITLYINDMTY